MWEVLDWFSKWIAKQSNAEEDRIEEIKKEAPMYVERLKQLIELSKDKDWSNRYLALKGIRNISFIHFLMLGWLDLVKEALRVVLDGILDSDGRVRWAAVQTLQYIRVFLPAELCLKTYFKLEELREHFKLDKHRSRSINHALMAMDSPYLRTLLNLYKYFGLEIPRELILRELIANSIESIRDRFRERENKRRIAARSAPIKRDETLINVLSRYTNYQLRGMIKIMKSPWPKNNRKADLIKTIYEYLTNPANLSMVLDSLGPMERRAIIDLISQGGIMPSRDFINKYGDDSPDPLEWDWFQPRTVMGRLKSMGLIAEGKLYGEFYVLIPIELRQQLETLYC